MDTTPTDILIRHKRIQASCLCGAGIRTHEGSEAYTDWVKLHEACPDSWRQRMTDGLSARSEGDPKPVAFPFPVHRRLTPPTADGEGDDPIDTDADDD